MIFFRHRKTPEQIHNEHIDRLIADYMAVKAEQDRARAETERLIALEREQLRQRREQEKLYKEQARQAEVLRKHEEQIAQLEERMSVAEGEIEFQAQQIDRIRQHIEYAERERDACVYGSTNFFKWDKKCLALEKQIHTAEKQLRKAQFAREQAEKKLPA